MFSFYSGQEGTLTLEEGLREAGHAAGPADGLLVPVQGAVHRAADCRLLAKSLPKTAGLNYAAPAPIPDGFIFLSFL